MSDRNRERRRSSRGHSHRDEDQTEEATVTVPYTVDHRRHSQGHHHRRRSSVHPPTDAHETHHHHEHHHHQERRRSSVHPGHNERRRSEGHHHHERRHSSPSHPHQHERRRSTVSHHHVHERRRSSVTLTPRTAEASEITTETPSVSENLEERERAPRKQKHVIDYKGGKPGTYRYVPRDTKANRQEKIQVIIKQPPPQQIQYPPPQPPQIIELQPTFPREYEHLLKELESEPEFKKRRHSRKIATQESEDGEKEGEPNREKRLSQDKGGPHKHELRAVKISEGTGTSMVAFDSSESKAILETRQQRGSPEKGWTDTQRKPEGKEKDGLEGTESEALSEEYKTVETLQLRQARRNKELDENQKLQAEIGAKQMKLGFRCPLCDVGMLKEVFTWTGWTCLLLCFPCGVFMLYCTKVIRCSNCRQIFRV